MSRFLPDNLVRALLPESMGDTVSPRHPRNARPFIFQDAERFIVPGNPVAAAVDPLTGKYANIRNRIPDGKEQVYGDANPGATSGGGSLPFTNDYVIAGYTQDDPLRSVTARDPGEFFAKFRTGDDVIRDRSFDILGDLQAEIEQLNENLGEIGGGSGGSGGGSGGGGNGDGGGGSGEGGDTGGGGVGIGDEDDNPGGIGNQYLCNMGYSIPGLCSTGDSDPVV